MDKSFDIFDAIIIGAGQGGSPLATSLAKAGWQVALVERKHVGGSCINTGCTPTKTMIASARVAHIINKAKEYGINSKLESVDFSKILQRKQEVVDSFREGSRNQLLSTQGLSLLEGEAHFIGKKQLEVNLAHNEKKFITANTIIINTGASPSKPPIPGLDRSGYLDSTTIMEINQLPEHLLIIGGGYVGLEFGQMFRRFGSKVTIIQIDKQLLPKEDEDVAKEITSILSQEGIEILLDAETVRVDNSKNNEIILTVKSNKKEQILQGSHLLVATGRTPNTSVLNLKTTGISVSERGHIPVNEHLETVIPGIYAIGDVNGGPEFTHISYDDFRILSKNILQKENHVTSGRQLPYVVFTDPQLGRIGITEKTAKDLGYQYRVAKMPMSWVARAIETGETAGMMKVMIDTKTDQILGAAILGIEGGELMAILQIAMLGKLPYSIIRDAIFAHPSLSESLNTLFGMMNG